jgi:hypothetical protein
MHFKQYVKHITTTGTFKWILVPFITTLISILLIIYESDSGNYQNSQAMVLAVVSIIAIFYRQLKNPMKTILYFTGLEKAQNIAEVEIALFGSLFLSLLSTTW